MKFKTTATAIFCLMLVCASTFGQSQQNAPNCGEEKDKRCSDFLEIPPICADQPCDVKVTGWKLHPTNSAIEVPIIEYLCKTPVDDQGDPTTEPTQGAHNINTNSFVACVPVDDDFPGYEIEEPDSGNAITCYVLKTCALACTAGAQLRPQSEWVSNRWVDPPNSSGNPGKTKTYVAGCNDGIGSGTPMYLIPPQCGDPCDDEVPGTP